MPTNCVTGSPLIRAAISDSALVAAWQQVLENHGEPGVDGITLERFGQNLFSHLGRLRLQLQSGTYIPGSLRQGSVHKKDGDGQNVLAIPNICDRILQTALGNELRHLMDTSFHEGSFSHRPGRSASMAIETIDRLREEGYCWVVDADIHHFFDDIDHALLLAKLLQVCRDEGAVALVTSWIKVPIQKQDKTLFHTERGIPKGAPISPLLVNIYLNEFDHQIEASGGRIVRYGDTFLVLCKRQDQLASSMELTQTSLHQIKLRINKGKTRCGNFDDGFSFLGVHFSNDGTHVESSEAAGLIPPSQVAFMTGQQGDSDGNAASHSVNSADQDGGTQPHNDDPGAPDTENSVIEVDVDAPPHLRTLYLFTPGLALARTNEQLSVSMRGHLIREIAIHTIDQILAMGPCSMTSPALMLCTEHGVGLHVMDARKKVTASLAAAGAESVQLRRTQYRACADDATCLRLAMGIVCQKITNSKTIIARFLRHHPAPEGDSGLAHLHDLAVQSRHAATLDALRGYEGAAARAYFGLVRAILPPEWCFGARVSHPPADPVNALFSYGYAILYGNCATLVQRRGLDPAFAFLHAPHEGHLALASDLMEPYRAVIVDAVVLSLIFRRQVRPDDFATEQDETVNCHINLSARRTLIHALEEKFNSRPAGSTQDFRRIMAQDITSLAQHIEGHIPSWEPYIA